MKKFFISILKMIITISLVSITPFLLPLLLKLFLSWKLFEDVEEFTNIIKLFYNVYPIIYIIITLCLMLWFFHKWEDIKNFFSNRDLSFGFKSGTISAKIKENVIQESTNKKDFVNTIKENKTLNVSNIQEEAKNKLGLAQAELEKNKQLCSECNKKALEEENSKLRNFAAYNIIDFETEEMLHIIYNENYINTSDFKRKIVQGYKSRYIRNTKFSNTDLNKIANNKYETVLEGLRFLNIIEPSEDDKIIKLTNEGKKFVEKYIE